MAYDIQVLVQALVYIIIFFFGFAVSIPLGVTVVEFDNQCILYTEFTWVNASFATYQLSPVSKCNFPIFLGVFACIMYSLGMGIYHFYAALRSKDPNIGYQMWVMPFILLNSAILILMFIACCMMSVGIKYMCDSLVAGTKKGSHIDTCAKGTKMDWNHPSKGHRTDFTYSHFYSYPVASSVAGWFTFLAWLIQVALCILRFVRNRRLRSRDMVPDPQSTVAAGGKDQADLDNFASVEPTA